MMADEYGGVCTESAESKNKTHQTPDVKPTPQRNDSMRILYTMSDLNEWLGKHGNPGCKRPARYPAFSVINGRKAAVYGLIEFNNDTIPDIQLWRLVSNFVYRCNVDEKQQFRIMLKVIVMNTRQGNDTDHNFVMEPDLDVTHLLVDLLAATPKYCFKPQQFVEAVPDIGKYANLKVWNWRIGLEIVPVRQ